MVDLECYVGTLVMTNPKYGGKSLLHGFPLRVLEVRKKKFLLETWFPMYLHNKAKDGDLSRAYLSYEGGGHGERSWEFVKLQDEIGVGALRRVRKSYTLKKVIEEYYGMKEAFDYTDQVLSDVVIVNAHRSKDRGIDKDTWPTYSSHESEKVAKFANVIHAYRIHAEIGLKLAKEKITELVDEIYSNEVEMERIKE